MWHETSADVNFTGHNWVQLGDALNLQMFVWIIAATLKKCCKIRKWNKKGSSFVIQRWPGVRA
jgi:hypothetical protein